MIKLIIYNNVSGTLDDTRVFGEGQYGITSFIVLSAPRVGTSKLNRNSSSLPKASSSLILKLIDSFTFESCNVRKSALEQATN